MLSVSYTIQLVTIGNPVISYLTSTVDKTHYEPRYCSFFCATSTVFFSYAGGALEINFFYCY